MLSFSIWDITEWQQPEVNVLHLDNPYLWFNIAGLRSVDISRGGEPVFRAADCSPFFHMIAPGTKLAFDYGVQRHNWTIRLDGEVRQSARHPDAVSIQSNGQWLDLPAHGELLPMDVPQWQNLMVQIRAAWRSPLASEQAAASLSFLRVIEHLLRQGQVVDGSLPANRLKALIDADSSFSQPLRALSEQCGRSTDHLRRLFQDQFGLTPSQYRQGRRKVRALELIDQGGMSMKEISDELGFGYASHFTAFCRQAFGRSPRQLAKRLEARSAR